MIHYFTGENSYGAWRLLLKIPPCAAFSEGMALRQCYAIILTQVSIFRRSVSHVFFTTCGRQHGAE